jgi:hypothetical protein
VSADAALQGVGLKMSRAQHHLRELDREVGKMLESEDVCVPVNGNRSNGDPCIRVRNVPEPDPRIGVIIGDIAHNLRSALDHLIYQLSIPPGSTEPVDPDAPAFPITSSSGNWRSARRRLDQARRGTKTRVERFQPYHRRRDPDTWLLWQLREISDIDKHRILHVAPAAIAAHQLGWRSDGPGGVVFHGYHVRRAPLEENAIAAWWDIDAEPEANVQVDANLVMGLAFDKTSPNALRYERVLPLMLSIGTFIHERLAPELAELLG